MSTTPTSVTCNSPLTSRSVPEMIKYTPHLATRHGSVNPQSLITMTTITGFKAFSICIKPRPKYKYTALPQASVVALAIAIGSTAQYQAFPATASRVSGRTSQTPQATRLRMTIAVVERPRALRVKGKSKWSDCSISLLSTISNGPIIIKAAHTRSAFVAFIEAR